MSEQSETSQEAFERIMSKLGYPMDLWPEDGTYLHGCTRIAWEAWQAAANWADTGELPGAIHETYIDSVPACWLL